jgi:hypothetical protein
MRLNALLLADAVSAPLDGKFYIHGGGLTRLTVPSLPFPIPQLGVLVRLEIDESEIGQTHEFQFALTDPDEVSVGLFPQFTAQLPEPPPGAPKLEDGEQRFVVLAINFAGINVGRKGLHTFEFRVDGESLGAIPLPVTVLSPEQLQAAVAPAVLGPAPSTTTAPNRAARRHPPNL